MAMTEQQLNKIASDPWLSTRDAELLAEIKRLTANYPGGDQDSQARAWCAVWQACEQVGMLSCLESLDFKDMTGRNRVIKFIEYLAEIANSEGYLDGAVAAYDGIEVDQRNTK